MSLWLFILYTAAYLFIIVWAVRRAIQTRTAGSAFLALVTFGLLYDNLILSLGNLVGEGGLLHALSVPRFVLHQLALPWVMVSAFEILRSAGHPWAQKRSSQTGVWLGALVVMALGILTRLVNLHLEPEFVDGVLRYAAVGTKGPPIVSIVGVGFTGVMGYLLWRKTGWVWLWPVVLLVFVAEGIPVDAIRRVLGSGVEVLYMVVLLAAHQKFVPGEERGIIEMGRSVR